MKKECIRAMKIEQWNKTVAYRKNEEKNQQVKQVASQFNRLQ